MSVMDKMKENAKKKEQAPAQKPAQAVAPLKAEPERSSQPPAAPQEITGRVAKPVKDEPTVVLSDSVVEDSQRYQVENGERRELAAYLSRYSGIDKAIESVKRKNPDTTKCDYELRDLAMRILAYSEDSAKWDHAKAVILAIDDESTKAEQLLEFAKKQKANGKDKTQYGDTLAEAVRTAKRDKDYDDVVKALIKIADTMGEYGMKDEAKATLKEAFYYNRSMGTILGIIPVRGEGSGKKKENNEEIEKVAKKHGLGHIKEPFARKTFRRLVLFGGVLATVITLGWTFLEATSGITGVSPRTLLEKAGIIKPRDSEETEYATKKEYKALAEQVTGIDVTLAGVDGRLVVVEPIGFETAVYDGKTEKDGEEYKAIDFYKLYGGVKPGTVDLETGEVLSPKLGKVRPFADITAEIKKVDKQLESTSKALKALENMPNAKGKAKLEEKKMELEAQLQRLRDEEAELKKLAGYLEPYYQKYYDGFCGVINLRTQGTACEILQVAVTDVNGNKVGFTIYDERKDCPDDCFTPGKPRAPQEPAPPKPQFTATSG